MWCNGINEGLGRGGDRQKIRENQGVGTSCGGTVGVALGGIGRVPIFSVINPRKRQLRSAVTGDKGRDFSRPVATKERVDSYFSTGHFHFVVEQAWFLY